MTRGGKGVRWNGRRCPSRTLERGRIAGPSDRPQRLVAAFDMRLFAIAALVAAQQVVLDETALRCGQHCEACLPIRCTMHMRAGSRDRAGDRFACFEDSSGEGFRASLGCRNGAGPSSDNRPSLTTLEQRASRLMVHLPNTPTRLSTLAWPYRKHFLKCSCMNQTAFSKSYRRSCVHWCCSPRAFVAVEVKALRKRKGIIEQPCDPSERRGCPTIA